MDTYVQVLCGQMWIQEHTSKKYMFKRDWTTQSMLTILSLMVNMINGAYTTT